MADAKLANGLGPQPRQHQQLRTYNRDHTTARHAVRNVTSDGGEPIASLKQASTQAGHQRDEIPVR